MIHAYASLRHYADHMLPILQALPVGVRGQMWGPRAGLSWAMELEPEIEHGSDPMLVAGLADAQHFAGHRPLVYVEHGAGQTYRGIETHGSYSGGNHAGLGIRLYICPSETVADRWRAQGATAVAVGCPRLDARLSRGTSARVAQCVAFTWHWWLELVPETQSAFPWYESALPDVFSQLRADGVLVIGHAHPRYAGKLGSWYRTTGGIPWVDRLEDVFDQDPVLVADNTSALYEAAALGHPTVVMNAPWYRRHVDHGLRFWSHVPGPQVDGPAELYEAITSVLVDHTTGLDLRERAAAHAYAHRDGHAAERAATAIMEALG